MAMKLNSKLYYKSCLDMSGIESGSVDLVVTSPPYPMIQMWDEIFTGIDPDIGTALDASDGSHAWELMNMSLDKVWAECSRVLKTGGFACINIGDATRKIGDNFRLYPNHSRISLGFTSLGFDCLPSVIWRKPTNAPNKFMGSGMLPSGAYVTLEHEWILIFRKGNRRRDLTASQKQNRQSSAYFWEERNTWFSDVWNLKGTTQLLSPGFGKTGRERSGAFPYELAHRLINMYSFQQDIVLDPFLGTGTTLGACMVNGRGCIGYEIDESLEGLIRQNTQAAFSGSAEITAQRLERHRRFIEEYSARKGEPKYCSTRYGFPVVTRQEKNIDFPVLKDFRMEGTEISCEYL